MSGAKAGRTGMANRAATFLSQLERVKDRYEDDARSRKLSLLGELSRRSLSDAPRLARLHEVLCFMRAYPDNPEVLAEVEAMLAGFADRKDLLRFRSRLTNSGIAGTTIEFPFFWFMACWLARRFPDRLKIHWSDFANQAKLGDILHLLVHFSETPALDELEDTPRSWLDWLKGPREQDAVFLIRRFEAMTADSFGRETFFEQLEVPMRLEPGKGGPSRTLARYARSPVFYQTRPLSSRRPSLQEEVQRAPVSVQRVTRREAQKLIDMAYEAMVTRSRDLDAFVHADPNDVRLVSCGEGLEFACFGVIPERRLLIESVYAYLTLKNGVPIGYLLTSQLFRSAAIAYNVFDTYRGTESAMVYGRVLAMVRHLFGVDSFYVDPFQLGHNNEEGLKSGAWWFYYKLGFRPEDRNVVRVLRTELARQKRAPGHRSSLATLQKLTAENMYFYLGRRRSDMLGKLALSNVGLRIMRYFAQRFGGDREGGARICTDEAGRILGVRSMRDFSAGERLAWERWSPIIRLIPGVERWTASEKRDLVGAVRAKGGRSESDFVRRFDGHRRLRDAMVRLARGRREW